MREQVIHRLRKSWKPQRVSVLFVGESPPASGDFFYQGNSLLYRATLQVFRQCYGQRVFADEEFLHFFRSIGCYLEDLSEQPLNTLKNRRERSDARKACQRSIGQRIRQHQPKIVVVIMRSIEGNVRAGMSQFHVDHIPLRSVPFPTYHRKTYVVELTGIIQQLIQSSVLPRPTLTDSGGEGV